MAKSVRGTIGNDTFYGTPDADTIYGYAGEHASTGAGATTTSTAVPANITSKAAVATTRSSAAVAKPSAPTPMRITSTSGATRAMMSSSCAAEDRCPCEVKLTGSEVDVRTG